MVPILLRRIVFYGCRANKWLGSERHLEKIPTMKTKPLLVVGLALMDDSGRVLMQRRPEHKQHGNLWEFPGGKVEPGEGPRAALVREIEEELGIGLDTADLFEVSFAADDPAEGRSGIVLLLYGCRCWDGEPKALELGTTIAWIDANGLSALAMPPLDVPLSRALAPLLGSR